MNDNVPPDRREINLSPPSAAPAETELNHALPRPGVIQNSCAGDRRDFRLGWAPGEKV